jgi:hypothetical protein
MRVERERKSAAVRFYSREEKSPPMLPGLLKAEGHHDWGCLLCLRANFWLAGLPYVRLDGLVANDRKPTITNTLYPPSVPLHLSYYLGTSSTCRQFLPRTTPFPDLRIM